MQTETWVNRAFAELEGGLSKEDLQTAFHGGRRQALAAFLDAGFPTIEQEDWIYTNLKPVAEGSFRLGGPAQVVGENALAKLPLINASPLRLVFRNGLFVEGDSACKGLPDGVTFRVLGDAAEKARCLEKFAATAAGLDKQDGAIAALNTAFFGDAALIHVARGVRLAQPLCLQFLGHGSAGRSLVHFPRVFIHLEEGAQATVLDCFSIEGAAEVFTNPLTQVLVGENAALEHLRLQMEQPNTYHVARLDAKLLRQARAKFRTFSFSGGFIRNDVNVNLAGEGAEATLEGLTVAGGRAHVDHHTRIDHLAAHCQSFELYKGIFADHARGVFNGKVVVHPKAQKTNAFQSNRNLLLSKNANINTKPELQIHADDVKCTHGATIGQLDDEALFYLRSRGIGSAAAKRMLIEAFASDLVEGIPTKEIRSEIEGILLNHLKESQAI